MRTLARLDIRELAAAAGVAVRTLHRLEAGGPIYVPEKRRHGWQSVLWEQIIGALAAAGVELLAQGSSFGAGVRWKAPYARCVSARDLYLRDAGAITGGQRQQGDAAASPELEWNNAAVRREWFGQWRREPSIEGPASVGGWVASVRRRRVARIAGPSGLRYGTPCCRCSRGWRC